MGGTAQKRIPWYKNGQCPPDRLVVFGRGRTNVDGDFEWRLPRATLRRWKALIARAKQRTGRTLVPAQGWSTDRPLHIQVLAQQIHGILAATPGRSSHGMVFEGQQTAAIDAGNWAWVYANHGGYAAFRQDFESEGFSALPAGRYPVEHHHIIDYHPWDDEPEHGGAPASTQSTPFEEDDMYDTEAEKRLFDKLDEVQRAAAPFKMLTYGTGLIAVNPLNGRWTILGGGYEALYIESGYAGPATKPIDDGAFRYLTKDAPGYFGDLDEKGADLGLSDEDMAEIKAAIDDQRVVLTQAELNRIADAAAAGAQSGGEVGARRAIEDITLVVKAG